MHPSGKHIGIQAPYTHNACESPSHCRCHAVRQTYAHLHAPAYLIVLLIGVHALPSVAQTLVDDGGVASNISRQRHMHHSC